MDFLVRSEHVRALLRLFGEAREVGPDRIALRHHLLTGVCGLLNAEVAVMVEVDDFLPGGVGVIRSAVDHGWATASERAAVLKPLQTQGSVADPALVRLMHERAPVVTRRREELVDDAAWYRSSMVMECRRPGRIDHAIYSSSATERLGAIHGICVNRAWGERPFSEEERNLVHLFHQECSSLYAAPTVEPPPEASRLSRRERETLKALLSGASEKQIAAKLELSAHTVHQYTKSIYRAFSVQSRAELLARCLGGPSV